MVEGNATLVVDLGNSSTKCTVLFGKNNKTGKFNERRFDLSNVFAPIDEGYQVSSDYDTETSSIMSVDTMLDGRSIRGHFCNGELQFKEKPLATIKPSASSKKYNLDSTVLSVRLALFNAVREVMSMSRVSDYKQIGVTWTVVMLLPPGDIDEGKDAMTDIIKAVNSVDMIYPEVSIPVEVTKVVMLPEGMCAYVGVVYDRGHVYRPDYKFLTEESVIVFDIGAGTTDCLLIKNGVLVQNSKYTVTQGGNNVFQLVRRKLRRNGLDIDDEDLHNGIIRGYVKDGVKEVSIIDEVNSAKSEVAQKIISEFQDYLDVTDIKLRSVGYVLVVGGGSIQDSDCQEILPLSYRVIENFKTLSPNSELIEIPKHTIQKILPDGDVETVEEVISPRDLNLIGASILAEVL